jgi:hypothetical protein
MYLQLIVMIIFILIIIYLYNKQKIESLDFSQGFNREGITNLLSAYNKIDIEDDNISNNIQGSLNLNGDISMNTINSNTINIKELNANNITAKQYRIGNIDFNDYKICLGDQSHCIKPYLLNLYSQINSINSPFNNLYLSDASNCVIYEYTAFNNNNDPYINLPLLLLTFGNNIKLSEDKTLSTIRYQTNINNTISRVSFFYEPQRDYDVSGGFKILIPNPNTLKFKCKVVWIEIKSDTRCSFRVTSSSNISNNVLNNNVLDVVYSNYLTYSNSLRPDGADYNMIGTQTLTNNITQWVPIPINYDLLPSEKAIYIRRNRTDNNSKLMISGLAFTTNPWNHCKLPAICIHWDLNDSNPSINKFNPSTSLVEASTPTTRSVDQPHDAFTEYITFNGKLLITRIPVINSGKDKLLYLNVANNTININIQNVLIQTDTTKQIGSITPESNILNSMSQFISNTITPIENFATTYDNPFARYFNSHKNNRYIATRIPAELIKSNFIRVILQGQVSSGTGLMIYEIGTHDLLYTE